MERLERFYRKRKKEIAIFLFFLFWLIPLLLNTGLDRYALEEMRVLLVGFLLGFLYRENTHKEGEKQNEK